MHLVGFILRNFDVRSVWIFVCFFLHHITYVQYIRTDFVKIHEYCGGLYRIVHRPHLTRGRSLTTPDLRIMLQKRLSRNRLYVLGPECGLKIFLSSYEWRT